MKLHRLVLTNYRGIVHREVEFPDRGVVVVSGANEIGKSSMVEALDLLLEVKDRSTKREVKDVKPTNSDVGAEVTAEMSTGPYRFVYRKRFHKQAQTELTVLAPSRQQLTGDEAHERVRAILAETVDMDLWRAQRILQSTSIGPVDLSGSDALSRALDAAAGQAAAVSAVSTVSAPAEPTGTEPLLVDEIDGEYRRYFTPTGRPTAEWLAAGKRLDQAAERVAECEAAVAEVDDAVVRHGDLTERLARVALERSTAVQRLEAARAAAEAVASVRGRLEQARALADAVTELHVAAVSAVELRAKSASEIDALAAAIAALDATAAQTEVAREAARVRSAAAAAADEAAAAEVERAERRVRNARGQVEAVTRRDEARRLAIRLGKLDAARAELADVDRALAAGTVTAGVMKELETATVAVERARIRAESASARVEVSAVADVAVRIGDDTVELVAGGAHAVVASADTDVEVPGLVRVRIVPGAPAADSHALLGAAREHLAGLLDGAGVASVDAASTEHERLRGLAADRDRLRATCDGLLGDDVVEVLRRRLAELTDLSDDGEAAIDADAAKANLATAVAAHRAAVEAATASRSAAAAAAAEAGDVATRFSVLAAKLGGLRDQWHSGTAQLAAQRAAATDEHLAVAAEEAAQRMREAATRVDTLTREFVGMQPDSVAAELADATRVADDLAARHDTIGEELRDVAAQLKVYGTEGRRGRLDDALADYEHALAEHARLRRRSGAADLLRSVMTRHRDASRERYVEPFRREVERLGRIVFGDDFAVEIDATLRILSRTLTGCTVPFESLSGGAKEQLGIVARLAGAALVAKEDGVPVVIDDALGFTDAVRLQKMGEVFDAVGGDGQVIVLTCTPERYASVADATRVELTA